MLLLSAVFLGLYFSWNPFDIAVFVFFVAIILRPVDSRFPAGIALFFLALTPFFLIFNRDETAETLAVYAYFFLAMTAMMGLYEIRKENYSKTDKSNA